ncbi:Inner membrane protein YedI [Marinomonas gallaica]|uniref:Inner membrane protein YedI n=1 Tax=Marinomonas gallaica TaxID=1806667 RepID=A0A1C3JRN1_9GAMM|nr:DUF808 domain-containing protein [Marinomonas gallaica]SBT17785.1 Inner membrane protein YedI [Marinomonas gallaica]SBT20111.1 Inner membrane protein YedI [Marinomonas gallaica]
MAGTNLLALIDDIATLLDDIALMSKVAAKKTGAVLGDDLALNAQQVTGVSADRELPVVWAVAKGSFINKLILVPLALLISAFAPWLITPLLMIGGLYLCFEGFEKVLHSLTHKKEHSDQLNLPEGTDLVAYEKNKIKGAIRTDFILSAEIVVIALGTVQSAAFISQVLVVSLIAFVMTAGVYALVAGIVKLDDLGLYLRKKFPDGLLNTLGMGLVTFAPKLMKTLSVVGTFAMFLVGGGIIAHALPHWEAPLSSLPPALETIVSGLIPMLINLGIGLLAGAFVYLFLEYVAGPALSKIRS